ncbi:hypothetical protein ACFWAT_03905 [Streptomyces syringium]|uniref:hypothetical protein n=1 Tax=Streptomyces syringium TaxID=76729 RepID=UPI00365ABB2F
MGRHRQPNRVMRAQATAIKAATMMGVAGALAFTFQPTGGNTAAEARSEPRFEPMPDPADDTAEPTAATHRDRSGKPAEAKPAGPSDVTFSAEPKVRHTVRQPTGAVAAPPRAAGAPAGPSVTDVSSLPAVATDAAADAVSGVASGVSGAVSAPERAAAPLPAPAPGAPTAPTAPTAGPAGGESAQRQAPLSGVVDGLLGGVTGVTGGLLGR